MMGGVSPETWWASYKYEINFDTLLYLVGFFLYELYYDAQIHKHQNLLNIFIQDFKPSVWIDSQSGVII